MEQVYWATTCAKIAQLVILSDYEVKKSIGGHYAVYILKVY
jgi:hypothetical protein